MLGEIKFHDSREKSIDQARMIKFEEEYFNKIIVGDITNSPRIMADIGAIMVDFMETMEWGESLPDIHPKSSRLFSFWGEDTKTKKVVVIVRGTIMLVPFTHGTTEGYYADRSEKFSYYPVAIVNSIKPLYKDLDKLENLLDLIYIQINMQWSKLKKTAISNLSGNGLLLKRFNSSVDRVLQYSFICPKEDRELEKALRLKNYQITSILEVLTSPDPSYDKVELDHHIQRSLEIIDENEN